MRRKFTDDLKISIVSSQSYKVLFLPLSKIRKHSVVCQRFCDVPANLIVSLCGMVTTMVKKLVFVAFRLYVMAGIRRHCGRRRRSPQSEAVLYLENRVS